MTTSANRPILIDGGCWANERGFGRFARCLVSAMAPLAHTGELMLLIDAESEAAHPVPAGLDIRRVTSSASPSVAAAAGGARTIPDLLRFARSAREAHPSVVFFPATYTYFPTPGLPTVVTVHDAMAESMPELIVPRRIDRWRWNAKQRLALRSAAHVFTVSDDAATQVQARLAVRPTRITVIGEAADPVFRPIDPDIARDHLARLDRRVPYVLYVGGFGPHKNVGALIAAFELVAQTNPCLELVLVGALDDPFLPSSKLLTAQIKASAMASRIALTGFVADDELVTLYNGATVTVLPSLEEGFGLTAVESAACGTPVVANRLPSVQASLGDAAVFVDACRPQDLADGMRRIMDDGEHRARLSQRGLDRTTELSWGRPAATVLQRLRSFSRS